MLNIEAYRTAQAVIDTQRTDDVIDFDNPTMNAAGDDFEEKLREAAARVPEDVVQRMLEAGCIDSSLVPDDYADLPDDHGNSEGDATAIRVGADVWGALDYDDDIDYFRFQAEQGQSYQIDVALGTLDDSIVDLYDADGSYLDASYDSPLTNVVTRQLARQGGRRLCVPEHRGWAPANSPVAPPAALPRATPAADIGVRSIRPRRPRTLDRSAAWNRR